MEQLRLGRGSVFSIGMVAGLGWLTLIQAPFLVGGYIAELGVPPDLAGWLVTAELGALALTCFAVSFRIDLMDKRRLCWAGLGLTVAGCLLCILHQTLPSVAAGRIMTGAGLGLLVAAGNALPAMTGNSEKLYAVTQVIVGVMGAALLGASPALQANWGLSGAVGAQAFLFLAGAASCFWLPRGRAMETAMPAHQEPLPLKAGLAVLIAYFVLAGGQSAQWVYSEQIAGVLQIPQDQMTLILTGSGLMALGAALLSLFLGVKKGAFLPLLLALGVQSVCVVLLHLTSNPAAFSAGILFVNATQVLNAPYMLYLLAQLDRSGRLPSLGGSSFNFGSALGPGLAAIAFGLGGYAGVAALCLAALAAALTLVTPTARRIDKISRTAAP